MTGPRSVSVTRCGCDVHLKFEGTARVDTAEVLHQQLISSPPPETLSIDWEHADHVDASVLQVLLAARNLGSQQKSALTVVKDSSKVRSFLKLAGLSDCFPTSSSPAESPE